jgi:hypothetical protein
VQKLHKEIILSTQFKIKYFFVSYFGALLEIVSKKSVVKFRHEINDEDDIKTKPLEVMILMALKDVAC